MNKYIPGSDSARTSVLASPRRWDYQRFLAHRMVDVNTALERSNQHRCLTATGKCSPVQCLVEDLYVIV